MKALAINVYKYDAEQKKYLFIPNVFCDRIDRKEGSEPRGAQFRYLLDDTLGIDKNWPGRIEQLWPIDAKSSYAIKADERICVINEDDNGRKTVLFDGYIDVPQADFSGQSEGSQFTAVGVESRLWDRPIAGRHQRDYSDTKNGPAIRTDLPTRFNPDDKPNCTPDLWDVDLDSDAHYPLFLDEKCDEAIPDPRTYWTVPKAVRYLLGVFNKDEKYVKNPDLKEIETLLQSRYPKDQTDKTDDKNREGGSDKGGDGSFDPSKPDTYSTGVIVLRDYVAVNKYWPDSLDEILGMHGFGYRFKLSTDKDGFPTTQLVIFRRDAGATGPPKELLVDKPYSAIDTTKNNCTSFHLQRDYRSVTNAYSIETALKRVEASFILAPDFSPANGDEVSTQYLKGNLGGASGITLRKYRWYVLDEAGEGHWSYETSTFVTDPPDLVKLFPDDGKDRTYVRRRRKPSHRLNSVDSIGRKLRSHLALSRDYTGKSPDVWDGTGTWQTIAGGWDLMEDRVGIMVSIQDPNSWDIGKYTGPNAQEPSSTLRGISSQANPTAENKRFFLRLTTTVEADTTIRAVVGARLSSPTKFVRSKRVDANDNYRLDTIVAGSLFNSTKKEIKVRDDTSKALDLARQFRSATEMPKVAGSVKIPYLTKAFEIGDRIKGVRGRGLSFAGSVGTADGEAPSYPAVVGISWDFSAGQQSTHLQLSDLRAEPKV